MGKGEIKKGDKVRVKKFDERPFGWNLFGEMDHLMGKVVEVTAVTFGWITLHIYDPVKKRLWVMHKDDVEPLNEKNEKIIIYRNGRETVALNKLTGEKGVARCNPSDEFDFDTGAKIAFCRLYGKEPELVKKMKEKERNTFKALCLRAEIPTGSLDLRIKKKSVQPFFCAGKVYEVKDGCITDEEGYTWGGSIDSIEDLNSRFDLGYNACFVKVAEDWE